jgi:type II secretory pathway predicted ATPase ExeA
LATFRELYGMSSNPFDKQFARPDSAFMSADHKQMVERLRYLSTVRGIGVFTSKPGMGKTFALRCLAAQLPAGLHTTAYISLSTVSQMDFYHQICLSIGAEPSVRKSAMFASVQSRIRQLYSDARKPLFLMLDEAQLLSWQILRDLAMLTNFDYDSTNCMSLALCGEPYLNSTLDRPHLESLRQRLVVHFNSSGLDGDEAEAYVLHKLRLGGAAPSLIEPAALSAVKSYGNGNPRLIDSLMTEVLLVGAQRGAVSLDAETVMYAVNNMALM